MDRYFIDSGKSYAAPRRALAWAGAGGLLAFAVIVAVEDATRPGFHPWRRWVSHLSLGPGGWANTLALTVGGLAALCVALAVALPAGAGRRQPPLVGSRRRRWWLVAGIVAFGAGLLLAAAFPIDPGLGWPPGVAAGHTPTGAVHQFAGGLAFAGLSVGAWSGRRALAWRHWARWSAVVGIVVPVAFLACSVLVGLDMSGTWTGAPSGAFERLALLAGTAWLVTLALALRVPSSTRSTMDGGEAAPGGDGLVQAGRVAAGPGHVAVGADQAE